MFLDTYPPVCIAIGMTACDTAARTDGSVFLDQCAKASVHVLERYQHVLVRHVQGTCIMLAASRGGLDTSAWSQSK